ncbi:MAG: transporter substrate-binding domain-containing protein [Oscillospiraceae bacterium]
MKKFIALLLAMVMVFALCACGNDDAKDNDGDQVKDYSSMTLDELKAELKTVEDGKLTVATSPDFAPYEFYSLDANGDATLAGFDIAFAQYIADKLGLELNIITMDFDGTLAELQAKNVDIGMAGYSPDPKRESIMSFTKIYYKGGQSFVTSKAKADEITSLETANNAKYKIGAQTGSIQYDLAEANTPDADNIGLTKVPDIIAEVISGKLDGAFMETIVAKAYQAQYEDLVIVCDVPYEQEGSAIGVNKDNEVLLAALNLIIDEAIDDGSLQKFVDEAGILAVGNKYEGLLDDAGNVPEAAAPADDTAA